MDVYEYLKIYGDQTFEELPLTEVDNAILSTLAYLDYAGIVSEDYLYRRFEDVAAEYLKTHERKDVYKLGPAFRNAYQLAEHCLKTERYKNIKLHHFKRKANKDTQFAAVTFKLTKKEKYIAYEGTDELISGWKEDLILSYKFPVPAHKYAIKYINREISIFDKKVYVGGHSKGGHLALVACMYMRNALKAKVAKVFSNDGPGLRKEQFESKEFAEVKPKYIQIVPNYSSVSMMLNTANQKVIKSKVTTPYAHTVGNWLVKNKEFQTAELSNTSKKIKYQLGNWLKGHSDQELEEIFMSCFDEIEKTGLKTLPELRNPKNLIKAIKSLRHVEKKYRSEALIFFRTIFRPYIKKGK